MFWLLSFMWQNFEFQFNSGMCMYEKSENLEQHNEDLTTKPFKYDKNLYLQYMWLKSVIFTTYKFVVY